MASTAGTASTKRATPSVRPGGNMRLWNAIGYRLPPSGWVSILHRLSGVLMFLLLPFVIWLFDVSVTSEVSYAQFSSLFAVGTPHLAGWFYKLIVLVLIWSLLHHLIAGLRHLWMDATHDLSKRFGRLSALATLVLSVVLTIALGAKLFFA